MKKPKIEDFRLKSLKLHNGGGCEVEFSYQFSTGNDMNTDEVRVSRYLNIHETLLNLIQKQKPNILQVEEINYRQMVTTLEKMGVDNQKEIAQVTEAMQLDAMSKIIVTGFRISGRDEKTNAIITYKKQTGNKKIAGRATTQILLSGNVYGFEQDLEEDLEEIRKEVYEYLYNNKHSDSAQGELWPSETEEIEEENEQEPVEVDAADVPETKFDEVPDDLPEKRIKKTGKKS